MPAHKPTELHALFAQAFNRGELDKLLALYEPNATVVVGGEPVAGHDSVRAALERWLAAGGQMVLDTRAVIEGPDGLVCAARRLGHRITRDTCFRNNTARVEHGGCATTVGRNLALRHR
jgi:ketosteroid isomerase-like protein